MKQQLIGFPALDAANEEIADFTSEEVSNDGRVLSTFVLIAARQIVDAYIEAVTAAHFKPESLIYIKNQDLLSAIERKTLELHNTLKGCYDLTISKEEINQSIRKQLKYLAYEVTNRR